MRIAMIGHKRIPGREGGIEVVVEELAVRMAARQHALTVYNRMKRGVSKDKTYRGVRIVNVPTINTKTLDAILCAALATVHALFCGYDIIHYHAEGPCAMIWLPRLFGVRVVATIHGLDWQRSKWNVFAARFLRFGERMAVRHADEIIVLSRNVQNYFHAAYRRETRYIPNGVEPPTFRRVNIINARYGLAGGDYLLFLARIVPEKGLHYLLEAFRDIRTDKKLVVAGDESHSSDYAQEVRRMAAGDKRVIFTGFVRGAELEELYSNAALYVLPSDVEGMPLTLLEAMSYGLPCLVSSIEENMEIIGDRGAGFNPGDVNDLKNKLRVLLTEESVRRSYPMERYSWDRISEVTLGVYSKEEK